MRKCVLCGPLGQILMLSHNNENQSEGPPGLNKKIDNYKNIQKSLSWLAKNNAIKLYTQNPEDVACDTASSSDGMT